MQGMKASPLEIYGLSVCFVAAIALAIALGTALYTVVRFLSPLFALGSWEFRQHLSNDAYWEKESTKNDLKRVRPSETELTREREASFAAALQSERHNAAQGLVKQAIFILVDVILFLSHWLIAQGAHR